MILRRLVEFADRLPGLPPGYQVVLATKRIRLDRNGKLLGVVQLSGDGTKNRDGMEMALPREEPRRVSNICPRLICDNANYVLGKEREKDKPGQTERRHQAYRDLLDLCAEETSEQSVLAVKAWIDSGGADELKSSPHIAEDDDLVFDVDGVNPVDLPSVQSFWARQAPSEFSGLCLVTGTHGPIVDRMPLPVKGIPGGQVSGTALVSINNPSGESYGLKNTLNSPIGAAAAAQIGRGINHLLSNSRHRLALGGAVYLYWTRNSEEPFDLWTCLDQPQVEQVKDLLTSANRGVAALNAHVSDFFILCLSANSSRVVVRDFVETTLDHVKANLGKWFNLLELGAVGEGRHFGISSLSFSPYREIKDMPAHVPAALLRSAVYGAPIPDSILALCIKRNAAMQGPFRVFNGNRVLAHQRMALIKACLQQKEEINLSSVRTDHPDPAYHCGRLLCVLERIQRDALGEINATVVDRNYGSACASPAGILGTLVNRAQGHLSKLRKKDRDYFVQVALEEVLSAIGHEFPKTLSLHRQGLFALGFYHQRAHDRSQAAAASAAKESKDHSE